MHLMAYSSSDFLEQIINELVLEVMIKEGVRGIKEYGQNAAKMTKPLKRFDLSTKSPRI